MDYLFQELLHNRATDRKSTATKRVISQSGRYIHPTHHRTGNHFRYCRPGVFALDKSTLFNKWKAETSPSLVYTAPYSTTPQAGVETSPVASQGIVYIGASDGYLYAIDQTTGIIKDKRHIGAPIFSTVAVSGNKMIVCDFAGNVYCFSSK